MGIGGGGGPVLVPINTPLELDGGPPNPRGPPRNDEGGRPLGVEVATGFRPPLPLINGEAAVECPALVATAGLFVRPVAAAALSRLGAGG